MYERLIRLTRSLFYLFWSPHQRRTRDSREISLQKTFKLKRNSLWAKLSQVNNPGARRRVWRCRSGECQRKNTIFKGKGGWDCAWQAVEVNGARKMRGKKGRSEREGSIVRKKKKDKRREKGVKWKESEKERTEEVSENVSFSQRK